MGQKSRAKQQKKQTVTPVAPTVATNPIDESLRLLNSQALSIDYQIHELYERIEFFGSMLKVEEEVALKIMPFDLDAMGDDLKEHQSRWESAYIHYNDYLKGLANNTQQYFTSQLLSQSLLSELKKARGALDQFEFRVVHYRNEIETFIKVCRSVESMDHYIQLGQKNIDNLQAGEVSEERRQALVSMLEKVKSIKAVLFPQAS